MTAVQSQHMHNSLPILATLQEPDPGSKVLQLLCSQQGYATSSAHQHAGVVLINSSLGGASALKDRVASARMQACIWHSSMQLLSVLAAP